MGGSDRARRWRAPLGVLLGMSLMVAACGDDDAEEGTTTSDDTSAEETEPLRPSRPWVASRG